MLAALFEEQLARLLAGRQRKTLAGPYTRAAVLLPLFKKGDAYHLLLTRRTEQMEHHKGQIAFPGGAQDKQDQDLQQTALRETFEEIGVAPQDVRILGELDDTLTITNFLVSPFVGAIPHPYPFRVNAAEIAELIEVPLAFLLDKANCQAASRVVNGVTHPFFVFQYGPHRIWGATANILKPLVELINGLGHGIG